MRWSFGRADYGPIIETFDTTWSEFIEFLADASRIAQDPADKLGWYWFTPMVQKPGTAQRRIEDIACLGSLLAFDLDHTPLSLSDIRLKLHGLSMVAYTTASSSPSDMHWRLIVKLDREYSISEHARLWRWFGCRLPLDQQTKNANRISFCPAQWDDLATFFTETGRPCRVDDILALVPEPPEPQVMPPIGPDFQPAKPGTQIVTPRMLAKAMAGQPGGRLYRLLCSAAKRYRLNGWELTVDELAAAGTQASLQFAPGVRRKGIRQEAANALLWAQQTCRPLSPMEKMRDRLIYEQTVRHKPRRA